MPLPAVAGTLVKDIDPSAWGLTNGTAITFANSGLTPVTNNPTFRTPVFDTGAPAVQTSLTAGFSIARPVADDFSLYLVIMDPFTTALGTPDFFSAGTLMNADAVGSQNDFGVNYRSSGFLVGGTGNPDTSAVGTHSVASGTHILSVIRTKATGTFKVYVDGVLDISITNNTNSLSAGPTLFFGRGIGDAGTAAFYGRFLAYDAAHNSTDQSAVESYLRTGYGEATVLRATKAVTYVPVGPPLLLSTTKAVMYVITGPDNGVRQRIKVRYLRGHR